MQIPVTDQSSRRARPAPRRMFVKSVEALSPLMRRLTFEGPQLETFVWSGPAAHVKLIFPEPVTGVIPEFTPENRPATMRTYTPRRYDARTKQLQVDFVLHGDGIASRWAAQARRGQELVILGPAPGYPIDAGADWYVIACDDAALPAAETLLEALPPEPAVTVFAQVADPRERRQLSGRDRTNVRWVLREHAGDATLRAALRGFAWPGGDGRVYVGCEAGLMRLIRTDLIEEFGFDRTRITTRGYWRLGATNHPDRDYGEERSS